MTLVKVRYTFELEIEVPDFVNGGVFANLKQQVEFARNEGGWCADNALEELQAHAKTHPDGCLCNGFRCEVIELASNVQKDPS